jgi:hypothetical protein
VLKMMKDEGFGCMYKTSIEGKKLHFVGYSFVDDTDIIQAGQPGEPFQVLGMRMQAAMDTWEGGIRATGGALEPESHFGTLFDSAGRMESGPMFQMRTHLHQYQFVIIQAIEWNLNVWRWQEIGIH